MEFLEKYAVYATAIIFVIEFLLGKTKLIAANSSIEAMLNMTASVLKAVFNKAKDNSINIKK